MANRFGRNQRRKLREAHAAELSLQAMRLRQAMASLDSERAARIEEKSARIRLETEVSRWAERIANILGRESAFARELVAKGVTQELFSSVAAGRPMRGEVKQPLRPISPRSCVPFGEARKLIDLFSIQARTDAVTLSSRLRFLIRGPNGDVALMMDRQTIDNLTKSGDTELAYYLLEVLIMPWMSGEVEG